METFSVFLFLFSGVLVLLSHLNSLEDVQKSLIYKQKKKWPVVVSPVGVRFATGHSAGARDAT